MKVLWKRNDRQTGYTYRINRVGIWFGLGFLSNHTQLCGCFSTWSLVECRFWQYLPVSTYLWNYGSKVWVNVDFPLKLKKRKIAKGLAIKISPTVSQCQTTRKMWNSHQYNKNWGPKYGSVLTSYENHGKVEEIGQDANQCHFPMIIKKVVEASQYMLE